MTGGDTVNAKVQIDASGNMTVTGGANFGGDITARSIYRAETDCGGLLFSGNSNGPFILPTDNTGAQATSLVDLGNSSTRFKDAYFQGNIHAGSYGESQLIICRHAEFQ